MRARTGIALVLSLVLVSGFAVSAADTVEVALVEGGYYGQRRRDGSDGLWVASGSKLSLAFDDGSTMDLSGPAQIVLSEMSEYSRTVDLISGTINQYVVKDVTSGVRTPYDSFVAVRNGTVQVKVDALEGRNQVTYKLFEGEDAKVVDGKELRPLGTDQPIIVERSLIETPPSIPVSVPMASDGEMLVLQLGFNRIEIVPKSGFTVDGTPNGGVLVTCILPKGQFGSVAINTKTPFTTNFYMTEGDVIEFDAGGNVLRHSSIVHIYAALDVRGNYDEAVADPSDSSPISTR
mgnify:CR=1 FL=1